MSTLESLPVELVEQIKLVYNDPETYDNFGHSVAMSTDGSTVLVGAVSKTESGRNGQGAVYVFTQKDTTWTQQAKLVHDDPAIGDRFGWSVALSSDGNKALISAYAKSYSGMINQGVAYIFTRTGTIWNQQAKLVPDDPAARDYFGRSVALSSDGNTALIGAHGKIESGRTCQGVVYVFTRTKSTWIQQAKLTHSDPAAYDQFGWSVSLSSDGDTALIGAAFKIESGQYYHGSAYIFTRSGTSWIQQAKLTHSDPAANDYFGWSVTLSSDGNTALIGAWFKTESGRYGQGAAYIFTRSGSVWTQQAKLTHGDPVISDNFGISVALSSDGSKALIGAWYKSQFDLNWQGAAYVFTQKETTWTQQAKLVYRYPSVGDNFGHSVALSSDGEAAFVGAAYRTKDGMLYKGAVHVFDI